MERYLKDQHGLEYCNKLWWFLSLVYPTLDNLDVTIKLHFKFLTEKQSLKKSNTIKGLPLSELHIVLANCAAISRSSWIHINDSIKKIL